VNAVGRDDGRGAGGEGVAAQDEPVEAATGPNRPGSSTAHLAVDLTAAGALTRSLGPTVVDLAALFAAAGHDLALVGGSVRDLVLGRRSGDLDFATDARPDRIEAILQPFADAVWDMGRAFGTIGGRKGDDTVEITTYRADAYEAGSRKPVVAFGDDLIDDLRRRDFTINAMALRLRPDRPEFVDPFGGMADLAAGILRTPAEPEVSFGDDPLRMLRACRFAAQLGFDVEPRTVGAMTSMAARLSIISAERIRDEFSKLLLAAEPRRGLSLLVATGLADQFLPEVPLLQRTDDEHRRHKDLYEHSLTVLEQAIELEPALGHGPDLTNRLAALLHDIGKPKTRRFEDGGRVTFHHHEVVGAKLARKRLTALRYPSAVVAEVSTLVELHLRFHGYGSGEWTDSAVRRYVRDAGRLLPYLHVLTKADCTTRNVRKARALRQSYEQLERRIAELREKEELDAIRPDLDGNQIMDLLGIGPGPLVGAAYRYLLEQRMEHGPMSEPEVLAVLHRWWRDQQPEQ
jgi:poly(A) polymerase